MPGSRITRKQEEMYMKSRQTGLSQEVAAARSGLSVRSGRRIEKGKRAPVPHTWRTRQDPLVAVWESHLVREYRYEFCCLSSPPPNDYSSVPEEEPP